MIDDTGHQGIAVEIENCSQKEPYHDWHLAPSEAADHDNTLILEQHELLIKGRLLSEMLNPGVKTLIVNCCHALDCTSLVTERLA